MNVLQQSLGETQSREVKTLPSHLMNFQWSREQIWNRVRVSTVHIRTSPKDPNCDMGLLAENALTQSCPERKMSVT